MRVEVDTHFGKIKVWDSAQMEWRDPKSEEVVPALTELVVELYLKLHRLSGQ